MTSLFVSNGWVVALVNPDELIQIRIDAIDRNALWQLTLMGAQINSVKGNTAIAYVFPQVLQTIRAMGYAVSVQLPSNVSKSLSDAYPAFEQFTEELQTAASVYPEICRLHEIGRSVEGRPLWFVQISDNVNTEEDEPEVKFISTMHGDEPVGMMLCLYLIRLLTESYGTDGRITELVNETEIWIMPLMNPDGYVHQIRNNLQGNDLNRSFPDRVSDPNNSPEGRPVEVQHLMNWGFSHSPVLAANFHTGALVVNYPYDSDPLWTATYSATPDDSLFRQLALTYASANPSMYHSEIFEQGITNGVAWYTVFGGMQDWNYVWMGCHEVTVELYETKWPLYSKLSEIWEDNRDSMLNYMEWALKGVRGIVSDDITGKPLKAMVHVDGIEHDVDTDPDVGDYHRLLLPGIYTLHFSADGYAAKTETIEVREGNAARLDVCLSPDACLTGIPTLGDAITVLQILTGQSDLPVTDVNGNGKTDLYDAIYILQSATDNIINNNQ